MTRKFLALSCASIALTGMTAFGCKTGEPQGSSVKADIHEIEASVRVVYKASDGFVYLVTCPKENGDVVDHAFETKALSRDACSATKADVDANGKLLVQKMNFQDDYLPKLKKTLGLAASSPNDAAGAAAIQAQIETQEDRLNKLAALAVTSDGVNKQKVDAQMATLNKRLSELKASLSDASGNQGQISRLATLVGFLDINSSATFNIAEQNAGDLLAPFSVPTCAAGSVEVAGACWRLGGLDASCNEVCEKAGLTYDPQTHRAGLSGPESADLCRSVVTAVVAGGQVNEDLKDQQPSSSSYAGCCLDSNKRSNIFYDEKPGGFSDDLRRLCACK